jgi:uncharacterized CHY-type Zn-finger protein
MEQSQSKKMIEILGQVIDQKTRCVHYNSDLDIIAIKFKCCELYYPCYKCHEEAIDHATEKWLINEFDQYAILCGCCNSELTISEYLRSENNCSYCGANFNPRCENHRHFYFEGQ